MNQATPPDNPFANDLDTVHEIMDVNAVSVYVAAKEAVKGFEKLGAEGLGPAGGTFIFTGNGLNHTASPSLMAFGSKCSLPTPWYIPMYKRP